LWFHLSFSRSLPGPFFSPGKIVSRVPESEGSLRPSKPRVFRGVPSSDEESCVSSFLTSFISLTQSVASLFSHGSFFPHRQLQFPASVHKCSFSSFPTRLPHNPSQFHQCERLSQFFFPCWRVFQYGSSSLKTRPPLPIHQQTADFLLTRPSGRCPVVPNRAPQSVDPIFLP